MLREGLLVMIVQQLEEMEGEALAVAMNLVSRLVLTYNTFASQYLQAGGLAPATLARYLPLLGCSNQYCF